MVSLLIKLTQLQNRLNSMDLTLWSGSFAVPSYKLYFTSSLLRQITGKKKKQKILKMYVPADEKKKMLKTDATSLAVFT